MKHYLNGRYVEEKDLLISPRDLGFLRSFAIFDFLRTYHNKRVFMLKEHITRLIASAAEIRLPLKWSQDDIRRIVLDTLRKNSEIEGELVMRIMISGGIPSHSNLSEDPSMIIIVDKAYKFPEEIYTEGVKMITHDFQRYMPACKTTSYIEALMNAEKIFSQNAEEMIYTQDGFFQEGCFSNFFAVCNGKILTAPSNVLPGVTRHIVLDKLGLSVDMKAASLENIHNISEAFITTSGKGIVPVVRIDSHMIGSGKVGPITKQVMGKYKEYIASGDGLT